MCFQSSFLKFQSIKFHYWHWLPSFRHVVSGWNFSQSKFIISTGCHLEWSIKTTNKIAVEDYSMNILPNYHSSWSSGFRDEDWNVKNLRPNRLWQRKTHQVMTIAHCFWPDELKKKKKIINIPHSISYVKLWTKGLRHHKLGALHLYKSDSTYHNANAQQIHFL